MRALLLMLAVLAAPFGLAAATEPADVLLEKIKLALLDAALQDEVRVVTAGYVDASGRLVESTYFGSDSNIAGVRVLSYLEDPAELPRVDVDSLPAALWPLLGQGCFASTQLALTRNVHLNIDMEAPAVPLAQQTDPALLAQVDNILRAAGWQRVPGQPASSSRDYQTLLLRSTEGAAADYSLSVAIRQVAEDAMAGWQVKARALGRQVSSGLRQVLAHNPLVALPVRGSTPPVVLRIEYSMAGPALLQPLRHELFFNVPARSAAMIRSFPDADLQAAVADGLAALLDAMAPATNGDAGCNMVLHAVHAGDTADTFRLSAGVRNGVQVGQRFLLLTQPFVQAGVLSADAAQAMAIAEVTQVNEHESHITPVAGPTGTAPAPVWALPF